MARQKKAEESQTEQAKTEPDAKNFSVARVFIKDLSFESKQAPKIFEKQWSPKLNLAVDVSNEKINDKLYEVVLKLSVTFKTDDETAFAIEIQQAGVFVLEGFDEKTVGCAGVDVPEHSVPLRGRRSTRWLSGDIPAPMLAPINFDALMEQRRRRPKGTLICWSGAA